jgi:hypothetical protein
LHKDQKLEIGNSKLEGQQQVMTEHDYHAPVLTGWLCLQLVGAVSDFPTVGLWQVRWKV